jgi:hypothetical protein
VLDITGFHSRVQVVPSYSNSALNVMALNLRPTSLGHGSGRPSQAVRSKGDV